MPLDEEELVETPAPARKRGWPWWVWVIVAVVALGGLGGGAAVMFGGKSEPAAAKGARKVAHIERKPEYYLALDPAFVVNFRDEGTMRYLQIGVTLMAHDQAALDAVKQADPVVRNALLMLFSSQDYSRLSDAKGKENLQAQALATVQKIVAERTGKPGVAAVYFTSFVMQ